MSDQSVREMAEMLRHGAKMLSMTCPECGSPLFQLKTGEIFCPREKKEVKIVKEGENIDKTNLNMLLEKTLDNKLRFLQQRLELEEDPAQIKELADTINSLLSAARHLQTQKMKQES